MEAFMEVDGMTRAWILDRAAERDEEADDTNQSGRKADERVIEFPPEGALLKVFQRLRTA